MVKLTEKPYGPYAVKMGRQEMDEQLLSKFRDQIVYLHQMKEKYSFPEHRETFNGFRATLYELSKNSINTITATARLRYFLQNDYDMIKGFNALLPFGITLEIKQDQGRTNVSYRKVTSRRIIEMNQELSKIIKDVDNFVTKVHEYFARDGLDFKTFINTIDSYRRKKCNPDESARANEALHSDLNELLKNHEELLEIFRNLRLPDYLSTIAYHFKYTPKLQEKIYDIGEYQLNLKLYLEIRKLLENEPKMKEKFDAVVAEHTKKEWLDETPNNDEIRAVMAEIFRGRKAWRMHLKNVETKHFLDALNLSE